MSIPPDQIVEIAKYLFGLGGPGIIILFLLEERRRLLNKVDTLQEKVIEEMKARLDQSATSMGLFRDYEKSFENLASTVNSLLSAKLSGRSRAHD